MKFDSKFCVYQETAKANLRQHEISKHTDNEGKQKCLKKCTYCNYTFLRIRNLKQHIASVHEGVRHKCDRDSCDFTCIKKDSLIKHIEAIHEGNKYKCEYCKIETTTMKYLEIHNRSQHGEKSYLCDQCDAGFTLESKLKVNIEFKKFKHSVSLQLM